MILAKSLRSIVVLSVALCGCNDSNEQKDFRSKPCPTGGLAAPGTTQQEQQEQIENYQKYACDQPQICPDEGSPFAPFYVIDPKAAPATVNLGLTNCSTGQKKLLIDKIVIAGDQRCFFTEAIVEKQTIDPGETVIVKVDYKPTALGEDHGQFQIHSNAENHAVLKVPFCSRALDKAPVSPDAGVADGGPSDGGTAADAAVRMRCQEVTSVTSQCHKP